MLHITVVAVGRLKERFWEEACSEYLKRLRPYASVEVREVADVDPAKAGGETGAVEAESKAVVSAIPKGASVFLLDIQGSLITSEGLAVQLEDCSLNGKNDICFIIGGSCGLNDSVRRMASQRLSFGRITLPHNLARVVLLEQIYRAFKINRNEPYHK